MINKSCIGGYNSCNTFNGGIALSSTRSDCSNTEDGEKESTGVNNNLKYDN